MKLAELTPIRQAEHEEVVMRAGARSGVEMAIAIHSTALGPALGGLRLWTYASREEALGDVRRLARGMTMKAAAAGLDLGGGKGVIRAPSPEIEPDRRREILLDFGDLVESLDGRYVTAEDVGTGTDDMVVVSERTSHVTGLPGADGGVGDPSPYTALGVEVAIRACAEQRFGTRDLDGLEIAVVGLGHVGARLATRLAGAGAALTVSDTDASKRGLADELGGRWVDPDDALDVDCDVIAPCALGGFIDERALERLRAAIVCGAANNQLADERLARRLADDRVLFAPDFIANAGGLINCYREFRGFGERRAVELTEGIEETMRGVFLTAQERGITPLDAAMALAADRLAAAVRN